MDFTSFLKLVPKINRAILPGDAAHQKMAPPERLALIKNLDIENLNPRKAAVMMLFYPKDTIVHIVLIVRNSYKGIHSSQIAFPGGKVEVYDASIEHTAIRETQEEIGVIAEEIQIVRAFSEVYIPPSNFRVFPFLGYYETEPVFIPDPREVADIIELALDDLLDESHVEVNRISASYREDVDVPVFRVNNHVVWGATAMMLNELKEVLKSVL